MTVRYMSANNLHNTNPTLDTKMNWKSIEDADLKKGERYLIVADFISGPEVVCATYIPCDTDSFWWETAEVRTNKDIVTHYMSAPELPQ